MFGGLAVRLRLATLFVVVYAIWTQVSLRSAVRPSFQASPYFEDTVSGNGTRYRVLKRASATQNVFVTIEALIRPGAPGWYPDHAGSLPLQSREQALSLGVREGTLAYVLGEGKRPGTAAAGEAVVVPAGEAHSYHNPSETEPLLIEIVIAPAPPLGERYYETLAGLSHTYGGIRDIPPLQMVLLLAEAGVRMRGQSKPFAFASEQVLPHAARLLGYKATYPEYTSGPAAQQETNAQAPASGSAPPSERREEL